MTVDFDNTSGGRHKEGGSDVVVHPSLDFSQTSVTEENFPGASVDLRQKIFEVIRKQHPQLKALTHSQEKTGDVEMELVSLKDELEATKLFDYMYSQADILFDGCGVVVVGARKTPSLAQDKYAHLRAFNAVAGETKCGFFLCYLQSQDKEKRQKVKQFLTTHLRGAIQSTTSKRSPSRVDQGMIQSSGGMLSAVENH